MAGQQDAALLQQQGEFCMKRRKSTILLVLVFLTGLSLLLYPSVSDWWNSFHQTRAIAEYTEAVAELDTQTYEQMWSDAQDYNASLIEKNNRYHPTEEETALYESLLNISGNGVMGYVDIPSIRVSLPIYHGVDDAVLQIAIGHIQGTSLPVGGPGTHCVISGHRGLPSARLFTDIDKLSEGDIFLLHVLNETLTYEVDQIRIVEPDEIELLAIEEGQDLCTLVTCTPYGVNSHRLLVRGHRIENQGDVGVSADAVQIEPVTIAPFLAAPALIILTVWIVFSTRKKRYRREK